MAEDQRREPEDRGQESDREAQAADQQHLRAIQRERQARVAKALVVIALVVLFIIFIVQNTDPVQIDFLFFEFSPALIWTLVVVAFLGGIVGYVLGRPSKRLRLHRQEEGKKEKE